MVIITLAAAIEGWDDDPTLRCSLCAVTAANKKQGSHESKAVWGQNESASDLLCVLIAEIVQNF